MFEEQKLPSLDSDTLQHCEKVSAAIHQQIQINGGAIRFDDFMRMALYEPGIGYYVAGTRKFGRDGDFITAPELGPLFGSAVAEQCLEVCRQIEAAEILEFGGGTGSLAASVLSAMDAQGAAPARYTIVELSPDLRQRQRELIKAQIPHLFDRVRWLNTPPEQPIDGCVLANEVLDALPVRSFENRAGDILEHWVTVDDNGEFEWETRAADGEILELVNREAGYELCRELDAYRFEICTAMPLWVADLANVLHRGLVLIFDYGSGRKERYGSTYREGSLRCFLQHRVHGEPLIYPGGQDITCTVDFTHAAEAAVAAGLQVAGYVEQVHFLTSCGILHKVAQFQQGASEDVVLELNEQLKTLLLPSKMGTHFKVLALTKGYDSRLLGFSNRDDRRSL